MCSLDQLHDCHFVNTEHCTLHVNCICILYVMSFDFLNLILAHTVDCLHGSHRPRTCLSRPLLPFAMDRRSVTQDNIHPMLDIYYIVNLLLLNLITLRYLLSVILVVIIVGVDITSHTPCMQLRSISEKDVHTYIYPIVL